MNRARFSRFALLLAAFICILFSLDASASSRGTGDGGLVVKRSANFGLNLSLTLWIDGRQVDRLQYGQSFRATLPAGPHEIMAMVTERRRDSSPVVKRVVIHPGVTTQLTAGFHGQDLVLL